MPADPTPSAACDGCGFKVCPVLGQPCCDHCTHAIPACAAQPPTNVVPFRSTTALEGLFAGGQDNPVTCACGEGWFVLVGQEIAPNGAVTVAEDGRITGYHGELRCLSCGSPAPHPPEVLTYG